MSNTGSAQIVNKVVFMTGIADGHWWCVWIDVCTCGWEFARKRSVYSIWECFESRACSFPLATVSHWWIGESLPWRRRMVTAPSWFVQVILFISMCVVICIMRPQLSCTVKSHNNKWEDGLHVGPLPRDDNWKVASESNLPSYNNTALVTGHENYGGPLMLFSDCQR